MDGDPAGRQVQDAGSFGLHQKRALEVKTAQILDLVLPEFSRLLSAAPGGDGEGGGATTSTRSSAGATSRSRTGRASSMPAQERGGRLPFPTRSTAPCVMAVAVAADAVGVMHKRPGARRLRAKPQRPDFCRPATSSGERRRRQQRRRVSKRQSDRPGAQGQTPRKSSAPPRSA